MQVNTSNLKVTNYIMNKQSIELDENDNFIINEFSFEFEYKEQPYRLFLENISTNQDELCISVDKLVQGLGDEMCYEEIGRGLYDDSLGNIIGDELTISDDTLTLEEEKELVELVLQKTVDMITELEFIKRGI